jgi:preprotein translocase subunit SecG
VTVLLSIVQAVISASLIGLVLLHSGRGGGLSDMFGGGLGATAAGSTVVEKNLDRITIILSLVFGFNSLILALLLDTA